MNVTSNICEFCGAEAVVSLNQDSDGNFYREQYTTQLGSIAVCAACASSMTMEDLE